MSSIEEQLRALTEAIGRITARMETGTVLPRVLTRKRAAAELSISVSKLKQLIGDGLLRTVLVGKQRMIPGCEVERMATPAQATPGRKPRSITAKYNAPRGEPTIQQMAQRAREELRKRR